MKQTNPQEPLSPSPSITDVLREFRELHLPDSSPGMQPLEAETLHTLERVEGFSDPLHLASQLTQALSTLWVARKSGELPDDHADATVWLLAEVSSLLEHAIEAHDAAAWWLAQHKNAITQGGASQAMKTTGRRKAKEAA